MTGARGCWRVVTLGALVGCNRYDLLRVAGFLTPDHPKDADVLIVVDNSASMAEEAVALAESMTAFTGRLEALSREIGQDGLDHAVEDYVDQIRDRGAYVDFQIGMTTTYASQTRGALLGDRVIERSQTDLTTAVNALLLCEATCFPDPGALPSDPAFTCADPIPPLTQVTREYLDCLCGADAWKGNCGASREEPLEAVALALCRSVPDPPPVCSEGAGYFRAEDVLANEGLLREDTVFVPIVITDEGDSSSRLSPVDAWPSAYNTLYGRFHHDMAWAVVGPGLDDRKRVVCPGVATSWGTQRLDYLVDLTGGVRERIHDEDCEPARYEEVLTRIGDLLLGRGAAFPLYGPADVDTIVAYVEGVRIPQAVEYGRDAFGAIRRGDGWSYDAEGYRVLFHGEFVPEPSDEVVIYYLPSAP